MSTSSRTNIKNNGLFVNNHFLNVSSDNNRMTLWDVIANDSSSSSTRGSSASGKSMTFLPPTHLQSHHLSAVACYGKECMSINPTIVSSSSKKKKQKTLSSSTSSSTTYLVAFGTKTSDIVIWDVSTASILTTMDKDVSLSGPIHDLVFSFDGKTLFSASKEKMVHEFDVRTGKMLRSFKGGKSGTATMAVAKTGTLLATANTGIKVFDLASGKSSQRMTSGHAAKITCMAFSPCARYLLSSVNGGRFVNLFKLKTASADGDVSKGPLMNFSLDSTPVSIFCQMIPNNKNGEESQDNCLLGAVSDTGKFYLWQQTTGKTNTTPIAPTTESPKDVTILGASFFNETNVCLTYGSNLMPKFDNLTYINPTDGSLVTHLKMDASYLSSGLLIQNKQTTSSGEQTPKETTAVAETKKTLRVSGNTSQATILPVHVISLADRGGKVQSQTTNVTEDSDEVVTEGEEELESNDEEDEMTLADRLEKLRDTFAVEATVTDFESEDVINEKTKSLMPQGKPQASSLATVLEQALQSGDNSMLEYVLQVVDQQVINATIGRLPSIRVIPFLSRVAEKFEKRPTRGVVLCRWIRSILMLHASFLMSVPDVAKKLSFLYQTMEARCRHFQQVQQLAGRMKLALGQISLHQQQIVSSVESKPLTVYNESDENGEVNSSGTDESGNSESESEEEMMSE